MAKTTLKDMTLDKLEAEAQREATPELIEELSKRVCEVQGNCAHRSEITWERNDGEMFLRCENKECLTLKDIPDITDPAVFWPLIEEKSLIVLALSDWFVVYEYDQYCSDYGEPLMSGHNPGVAVALAYLKIKEMEGD